VPAVQVREALRRNFCRWGCPARLRLDNGIPWGIPGGLPSGLSLWAAGLGVPMHFNDPYCPQQNGVVESTQGTSQRWVEPGACGNIEELARRVQQEDYIQRERYPAINGMSRRDAYPGLLHTGRGYCLGWEKIVWDVREALRFLGRYRVRRKVSKRGQVSLYHRLVQLSPEYGGEWVYVQLDPEAVEWVISDVQGKELRRRPAPQFTAEAIMDLDVARP
jgi:transposase InsO family protein